MATAGAKGQQKPDIPDPIPQRPARGWRSYIPEAHY